MPSRNPVNVPPDDELILKGHDVASLGPSDSSDTGADMVGLGGRDSTSDRQGTGEREDVENDLVGEGLDITPNRIVRASRAGLGGGLDQAEEAQFGITDEEIAKALEDYEE
jgi:hypothetical protein